MQKAEDENHSISGDLVELRDDFYRDGFHKIWLSIAMIVGAIGLLIVVSLYFFLHQVLPVSFPVYEDFRVQADIPVDRPYLHIADLAQWVSEVLPQLFTTDFINYDLYLKKAGHAFTTNGWSKYMNVVNVYLNRDSIEKGKIFVSASAAGAPVVLNQGLLEGVYAWWVQMPVNVRYSGVVGSGQDAHEKKYIVQALVVRVPTLNDLEGVGIENIIVTQK